MQALEALNVDLAARLGAALALRGLRVATAESCTGGAIARALTETAGSSAWFDCGFVTYSNAAKERMLGVRPETLRGFGAVSEPTAAEMAEGALRNSGADVAVSVTGIAGPGGAVPGKPVGTVCFGWAWRDGRRRAETVRFDGDRVRVRLETVRHALERIVSDMGLKQPDQTKN